MSVLDLETARSIVAGARAHGSSAGFKPLTVVVLDTGGHVIAVEREDGASMKRFEIGFGKAHGALSLGMGSRSIMGRAEQQAYFIAAVTSAVGGALVPVPGGVLVRDAGGDLLIAYIAAMEVSTRLAAVGAGGFHGFGFHPTGLIGAFGSTLAAGRLLGLDAQQIAMAQGITILLAAAIPLLPWT